MEANAPAAFNGQGKGIGKNMIYCDTTDPNDRVWCDVKREVERMGGLDNYPDPQFKPEAFRALCMVCLKADGTPQLRRVITDILNGEDKCPTPRALREIIEHEQNRGKAAPQPWEQYQDPNELSSSELQAPEWDETIKGSGVFRPGRYPLLDEHLELLKLRRRELERNPQLARFTNGVRPETELTRKIRAAVDRMRVVEA